MNCISHDASCSTLDFSNEYSTDYSTDYSMETFSNWEHITEVMVGSGSPDSIEEAPSREPAAPGAFRPARPAAGAATAPAPPLTPASLSSAVTSLPSSQERDNLYASLQALVRRLIRKYGDDPQLREELPNEIYLRFCILLNAYDASRNIPLQAYLVSQLEPSIYTYVRRHWRVRQREGTYDIDLDAGMFMQAIDPTYEWDERLLRDHLRRHLPKLLSQLTPRQRQVVLMRYYEGRAFPEIASQMGIETATARSLLRYGLNSLRRMLEFIDMM